MLERFIPVLLVVIIYSAQKISLARYVEMEPEGVFVRENALATLGPTKPFIDTLKGHYFEVYWLRRTFEIAPDLDDLKQYQENILLDPHIYINNITSETHLYILSAKPEHAGYWVRIIYEVRDPTLRMFYQQVFHLTVHEPITMKIVKLPSQYGQQSYNVICRTVIHGVDDYLQSFCSFTTRVNGKYASSTEVVSLENNHVISVSSLMYMLHSELSQHNTLNDVLCEVVAFVWVYKRDGDQLNKTVLIGKSNALVVPKVH
ncbi:hypothetical protein GJ496_010698 [Pomphorhynchus laevis]|nr:hypothetical protein GJ496_010698 [Pomphorhynchus laevis]